MSHKEGTYTGIGISKYISFLLLSVHGQTVWDRDSFKLSKSILYSLLYRKNNNILRLLTLVNRNGLPRLFLLQVLRHFFNHGTHSPKLDPKVHISQLDSRIHQRPEQNSDQILESWIWIDFFRMIWSKTKNLKIDRNNVDIFLNDWILILNCLILKYCGKPPVTASDRG